VQPNPHANRPAGKRALAVRRSGDLVRCASECDEERITLRIDLDALVVGKRRTESPSMLHRWPGRRDRVYAGGSRDREQNRNAASKKDGRRRSSGPRPVARPAPFDREVKCVGGRADRRVRGETPKPRSLRRASCGKRRVKGVVFNLLEEIVSREYGEESWDALLEATGLEGAYTSLGGYPDGELMGLVAAAACSFDESTEQVVRWFGRNAIPLLARSYPSFFTPHGSTRSFLLTLNDIIHPEVRKLYPGADVPVFDYDVSSNDLLMIGYQSPRKLCAFAEGLIEGAADYYSEAASICQPTCMNRGDAKCRLHISFSPIRNLTSV
jgi:hypothetical protein